LDPGDRQKFEDILVSLRDACMSFATDPEGRLKDRDRRRDGRASAVEQRRQCIRVRFAGEDGDDG
jgi:hypothetical protein